MVVHRIVFTLFVLAQIWNSAVIAQCAQLSLPLETRVGLSDVIVEGRVIDQFAFEGPLYDMIYTTHVVEVYKVFTGDVPGRRIEITTHGGVLGDRAVAVSPSLELQPGAQGVFMLRQHSGLPLASPNNHFLLPVAGTASFISTQHTDRIKDDIRAFDHPADLYSAITAATGRPYNEFSSPESASPTAKSMMMPVITDITPLTTTAGTGSNITITGSGFGAIAGTVFFDNANDGQGGSYAGTSSAHIVSWNDTQIVTMVPSNSGTGKVFVQTTGPINSALSNQTLTVTYGVRNAAVTALTYLIDHGTAGDGGYHFHIGTNTANNGVNIKAVPGAMTAVERAMQTIHSTTNIPLYAGENCPNTSVQSPGIDGINLLSFDSDAYNLASQFGANTIGIAIANYTLCDVSGWEVINMDVILRRPGSVNWHYGADNPGGGQTDFESVVLHEMGHAFSLTHINNTSAPMHYIMSAGTTRRAFLAGADLDGAQFAHSSSSAYHPPVINCGAPFNTARQYGAYIEAQDCSQLQVLPVELIDFEGKSDENGVQLFWNTASELNNEYFSVEHSANGRLFRELTRVQGAGTISEPQQYRAFDGLPSSGMNYYRLAQYDFDGTRTYSHIISVKYEGKTSQALIAPNPVNDNELSLWYNSPGEMRLELQVIALDGKICTERYQEVLPGNQHISLPLDDLNAGLYLLRIRNGNETQVLRFSKI
ncbi:MAG: IPT/TIG domain-containing protein [Saprospiraceae bacterium]|nr:IPT/TIG domain-containing protein [Saprospiraceae bacterium]